MSHFNVLNRSKATYSQSRDVPAGPKKPPMQNSGLKLKLLKNIYTTYPKVMIEGSQLFYMSWEDMLKLKVCMVSREFKASDSESINNTPNDSRLGCYKPGKKSNCGYCHQGYSDCPGHFGLIEFPEGVRIIHPTYHRQVVQVLSCVCHVKGCSSLLLKPSDMADEDLMKSEGMARLHQIYKKISSGLNTNCHNCGAVSAIRPVFKFKDTAEPYKIKFSKGKTDDVEMPIKEVEDILNGISQKDLRLLGFVGTNPKDFIMKGLLVIPLSARPPTYLDDNENPNDITQIYNNIIKFCQDITNGSSKDIDKTIRDIHRQIKILIDSKDDKGQSATNNPIKSIANRLRDKDGLIRGNAMGKRVNYCLRTVAGPGYSCNFDGVKIPYSMRKELTKLVPVTKRNYQHILDYYIPNKLIKYMFDDQAIDDMEYIQNNRKVFLYEKYESGENTLEVGDLIEIYCEEGDMFLINRQPSLHKYSIMGAKVELWDFSNLGLHSSWTTPLNADFDGDELNGHKLQTIGSQVEARYLVDVGSCVMNSQTNKPTMGLVFNCPNSAYLLTRKLTKIYLDDFNEAIKLLVDSSRVDTIKERFEKYAIKYQDEDANGIYIVGKALFSVLLPADFYYFQNNVLIKNGVLVHGTITSSHIGTASGSLIHQLWKTYGKRTTVRFYTEGQKILDWYLEYTGFSIGYSSCVANVNADAIKKDIDNNIYITNAKIKFLGDPDPDASEYEKEFHESEICKYLSDIENSSNKLDEKTLHANNDFNTMLKSGAKGNKLNVVKILSMLGQIFVSGSRPELSLNNRSRCNVYCVPGSKELKYRGFCKSSFMGGLSPIELFFHLMASRVGLVDTSVNTASVGFLSHKINKNFEDVLVWYDGSVRNVNGKIYQYSYNDGFFAANLIPVKSKKLGLIYDYIDLGNVIGRLNTNVV